jgi:hypothetical protein
MRALLVILVLGVCVFAGEARADGDPASDYLLGTQVFLPYDVKAPKATQQELVSLVHDANKSGYAIRVALIGSAYDLGAVTSLWRKPKPYAKFLGAELQFVYKQRLLVVMPNGFGFNWPKHSSTKEYAVLSRVPIRGGASGMFAAAETAVRNLATAAGVKIARTPAVAVPKGPNGRGITHSRALILLAAVGTLAILVLFRLALRR